MSLYFEILNAGSATTKPGRRNPDELVYLMMRAFLPEGTQPTEGQLKAAMDIAYGALEAEFDAGKDYGEVSENARLTGDEF